MIPRLLLLLAFALQNILCFSQSLFEFDYHFDVNNTREKYRAFMVRNNDGTGFMRVKFYDEDVKAAILVDLDMQEHYLGDEDPEDDTKTDSSVLVFRGYNPKIISGPAKYVYDPDLFIFQYNAQTGTYEPISVISEDKQHHQYEGVINDVAFLNEDDLTKELMSGYFTSDDDVYKNLFEEAEVRGLTPAQQQTKLHLVLVANTEDVSIGSTCIVDKDATYKTFSSIAEFLGIGFSPKVISGKDFSKLNVENAINELQPAGNDIVVFYYSGHGFSDSKDRHTYPYLDLRDKVSQQFGGPYALNLEDIYLKIRSKGARLNLVLSDCCNADPNLSNIHTGEVATTRHSSVGWNMQNCRALFLNEKPASIMMTAASKGELSAGNSTGGIFTFNFRETMEKSFGPFYNVLNWQQVLNLSKQQTITQAMRTLCVQPDNSRKVCVQNPVFRVE